MSDAFEVINLIVHNEREANEVVERITPMLKGDCPRCGGELEWEEDSSAAYCRGKCSKDVDYTFIIHPQHRQLISMNRQLMEMIKTIESKALSLARGTWASVREELPHAFSDRALAERVGRKVFNGFGVEDKWTDHELENE